MRLPFPGQVEIWSIHCDAFSEAERMQGLRWLTEKEQERYRRFLRAQDRVEYLTTRMLQRCVFSHMFGAGPETWRFSASAKGRPFLVDGPSTLAFNLTHSAQHILCAVGTQCDLGLDLEYFQQRRDILGIAKHFFTPLECGVIAAQSTPLLQHLKFLEHWTLKEAYMKARGMGFGIDPVSLCFEVEGSTLRFAPQSSVEPSPDTWSFVLWDWQQKAKVALCVRPAPLDKVLAFQAQPCSRARDTVYASALNVARQTASTRKGEQQRAFSVCFFDAQSLIRGHLRS
ncbi:MAG: 4'-phosphopantetheinyl transferase superfamily protein [Myxococcota bacterium]